MFYTKDLVVFSDRNKREENQDRAFYLNFDAHPDVKSKMTILAVLDGVSNSNGAHASRMAAEAMRPRLAQLIGRADSLLALDDETKKSEILICLKCAIHDADEYLRQQQIGGIEYGTTITLAVVFDEAVFAANVGDSPAYLLRLSGSQEGRLLPLFECHNEAGVLVQKGLMSPEEALRSPARNCLLRMAGGTGVLDTEIHTTSLWLSQTDLLMLGSDGALAVFSTETLTQIIRDNLRSGLSGITAALFEAVQDSSSTDNFTILAQWLETN